MPARRNRDDRPGPRLPGAGSVSPEPVPGTQAAPPAPEMPADPPEPEPPARPEPRVVDVLGRFVTAARALTFAEQLMRAAQGDDADCYRAADGSWWVAGRAALGAAREMSGLGDGRLFTRAAGGYAADRGWGDEPAAGPAVALPDLAPVTLLDLVQVAGLHRVAAGPLSRACVLVPGHRVRGVLERAQDLRLRATYQLATLDPLFPAALFPGALVTETGQRTPPPPARSCYAVWLAAAAGRQAPGDAAAGRPDALPRGLLSALDDDPFTLLCRPVEDSLLIGYGTASPLSDGALARLAEAGGAGTWLFAAPPDGCARVTFDAEPLDAASLVELGPGHALTELDGTQLYTEATGRPSRPERRPLTLVPAAARVVTIDAVLLDDADLDCLPLILAGEPLADVAVLVRGGGRYLLTAPGGLLTELPVGQPLTCVGPGSVYVPAGFRLDPPLGPAARAALLRPDAETAQVLLAGARLGFQLDQAEPVWALWAGPVPEFDPALPRRAREDLDQAAREVGDPPRAPDRPGMVGRLLSRGGLAPQPAQDDWRKEAAAAEREREFAVAAQLYARHNDPLRAARMWEREAEEKY